MNVLRADITNSPHSIIRKELDENFREGVAAFLGKNCTVGQESQRKKSSKELTMSITQRKVKKGRGLQNEALLFRGQPMLRAKIFA